MSDSPNPPKIEMIPLELIDVVNPRDRNRKAFKEFVANIAAVGLKRPITVARREGIQGTHYDLVCGQGRLEAFQALGQSEIPAIVVSANDEDALLMSLVENIARSPYRPVEQMRDVAALRSRGYSEAIIAEKIGVSLEYIRGILHLLDNGEHRLLRAVDAGQIPVSVAIDIAAAKQSDIRDILQHAYEQSRVKGKGLLVRSRSREQFTLADLLRTYEDDTQRKRLLVRKAEVTRECLTFIVEAFRQLRRDPGFMSLLKAEGLLSIPRNLELRIVADEVCV
jgi:ParB family chromosome partitioning protein